MSRTAAHEGKRKVIRGRAIKRVAIFSVVLLGVGPALGFLFAQQDSSAFIGAAAISFCCWIIWLLGISSKVTFSEHGIRVTNFIISHMVSWDDFDSFVLESGIALVKRDESRVWMIGYSGSLLGALTRYRMMRKSLVTLQEAGKKYRRSASSAVTRDSIHLGLPVLAGWLAFLEGSVLVGMAFH